ncbi:MAG: ABC transporter ATP-binding protein, partial [SAR324 cluster bacterium]|nr:ABC transporter ATP-binding protein [SAR324 cluster bacterium]
ISSGTIRFDDVIVNDLTPEQRNVAMAFESYALYPNLSIAENLAFPLEVRGIPLSERTKAVNRIAEMLQITELLDQRPGQLSGCQQQRVSLGRALIRETAVFILDEVLSHLDAHLKFQMLFELKKIHYSLGKTMVYVTHDQMEALALSDRVAVMANAKLQQFGNRNELYHKPVNRFVADFIGEPSTNFLNARISSVDQKIVLEVNADLRFHPDSRRQDLIKEKGLEEVLIGIRPQYLTLQDGPAKESVTAEVLINEYLGERNILEVKNGSEKFRAVVPPECRAVRGDRVTLFYEPNHVLAFDPQTEECLL